MKHEAHFQCYRIHLLKLSMGTRYILHAKHSGDVSHNPAEVDVAKTIRRIRREIKQAEESRKPSNVELLPKKKHA